MAVCLLSGCSHQDNTLKQATEFREALISASACTFQAIVTADYGTDLYTFQMDCDYSTDGNLSFTVTDPETISGIQGCFSLYDEGKITFDDVVLAFPILSEKQPTPVSAPWIFITALRSGYLSGVSRLESGYCLYIDDSYQDNPLFLEVYTDGNMLPIHADIIWQDQRILSLDVRFFTIQ